MKVEIKSNKGRYKCIVIYDEDDTLVSLNADFFEVDCEFYLISDLKFLSSDLPKHARP